MLPCDIGSGVNHVPLLSQTRGCSDRDHQEGHTWCWLWGQIHREKVSVSSGFWTPTDLFLSLHWVHLYLISCFSLSSPLGAIGASMVTTAGRQSICSRRWSPPIRRPSSLTWGALTASCLYPSLTVPRRLPRRVLSKNHELQEPLSRVVFPSLQSCFTWSWDYTTLCYVFFLADLLFCSCIFCNWLEETTNASVLLNIILKHW